MSRGKLVKALSDEQGSRAAFLVRQIRDKLTNIIAAYEMGLPVSLHDEKDPDRAVDRWFQELCQVSNQLQSVTWKVPHLLFNDDSVVGIHYGTHVVRRMSDEIKEPIVKEKVKSRKTGKTRSRKTR